MEVGEEWRRGRRVREDSEGFLVELTIGDPYRTDAICITLKGIPFGLGKRSCKRILLPGMAEKKEKRFINKTGRILGILTEIPGDT